MLSFAAGIGLFVVALGGLWLCLPRGGEPKAFATMPVLEWAVPVVLLCFFASGLAFIISGVSSLM